MGAHTATLRLLSVASLVGAGLIAALALNAGTLSGAAAVLGTSLVVLGVALIVALRRGAAAQAGGGSRYVGRHRRS